MYCATCGSHNPEHGRFCCECGNPLARTKSELGRRSTEKELLFEVLHIAPKPNECHRCGAEGELTRYEFAIAKVLSVKREWGETIALAGLSVVSIVAAPVTGFAGFSWKHPNKTTSFNLLKAKLVLCRPCLSWARKTEHGTGLKDDAYRCHPWATMAHRIGYTKYFSAEEVARLKPAR